MKSILMKILPHVAAVIVFLILSSLMFNMEGGDYNLRQSDIDHVMGMSKELMDYRMLHDGEEALWSNNMFGGMPGYQTNVMYPSNILRGIDSFLKLYQDPATGAIFMCMLGFYIFCLCMRINPWIGIAGSVAFGFSTINILFLGAGHTSKINAIGYMAPALGGLLLAYRGKWLLGAGVFALFFGLHVASSHLQMTYYLAFLLGAVALTELIRLIIAKQASHALKASAALLVALAIGILPNVGSLVTTYEYSKLTTRGKTDLTLTPEGAEKEAAEKEGLKPDYILQYNMAGREWMSVFLPNIKGGSSGRIKEDKAAMQTVPKSPKELKQQIGEDNHYWGDQDASGGAFYFGAFMMFIFFIALIFCKDTLRWPFLVLMLLAIALSARELTSINEFFINDVPFYGKFRDHKMMLVLLQVMAPALALLFINELLQKELTAKARKYLLIGTGALLVIGIIICTVPKSAGDLLSARETTMYDEAREENPAAAENIDLYLSALTNVRAVIYKEDGQRSILLFILAAGFIAVLAYRKAPWYVLAPVMFIIVVGDMWTVATRYMNDDKIGGQYIHYVKTADKYFPYQPDQCDLAILEREKESVPDFESKADELTNKYRNSKPFSLVKDKNKHAMAAQFGALSLHTNYRVLLGSRGVFTDATIPYFHKSLGGYHAAKLKRYQEIIDFYLTPEIESFSEALQTRSVARVDSTIATLKMINMLNTRYIKFSPEAPPIDNPNAYGNAWFVSDISFVPTADDEMKNIATTDTRRAAVVHEEFRDRARSGAVDSTSIATLDEYATKYLKFSTHTTTEAPLIFSEIYYPEGWVCTIDGAETPYFRANYALRGVMVPAGDHTVEWSFEPASYERGVTINRIGSALLVIFILLTFGLALWPAIREMRKA